MLGIFAYAIVTVTWPTNDERDGTSAGGQRCLATSLNGHILQDRLVPQDIYQKVVRLTSMERADRRTGIPSDRLDLIAMVAGVAPPRLAGLLVRGDRPYIVRTPASHSIGVVGTPTSHFGVPSRPDPVAVSECAVFGYPLLYRGHNRSPSMTLFRQ